MDAQQIKGALEQADRDGKTYLEVDGHHFYKTLLGGWAYRPYKIIAKRPPWSTWGRMNIYNRR